MKSNSKVLEEGFKKAEEIVRNQLRLRFVNSGYRFLRHAKEAREFESFTGNTLTSFAFGCYEDGVLFDAYASVEGMIRPLMKKIQYGESVYLERPYEGQGRTVTGQVNADSEFGYEESRNFLQAYKPSTSGYVLVVTTGTEYSEFIEDFVGLNVLTDTYLAGKTGLVNDIMNKKML